MEQRMTDLLADLRWSADYLATCWLEWRRLLKKRQDIRTKLRTVVPKKNLLPFAKKEKVQ